MGVKRVKCLIYQLLFKLGLIKPCDVGALPKKESKCCAGRCNGGSKK